MTGAGTNERTRVVFDAPVSMLENITVFGIADLVILDATRIGDKLKHLIEYTAINKIGASTLFSNHQPLRNDSTTIDAGLISTQVVDVWPAH